MKMEKEIEVIQADDAHELKKHVAVIHSSNKLTLLQRKIANALLFNAYKDLQEKDEHIIHISQLCDIIGYHSNDHKSIKTALINLISTVLEWNLVDGEKLSGEGVWNASSIIAGATIDGAICTYSYSLQMRKLLYRPQMYARLDMQVQARFQSSYGLALYENCNRFQDIGQTPWFTLAKFRKLMGVEEGKYKIFRDLKTRVLDKALQEVNQYSPMVVYPQLRKQNRQVVSIQFVIKKTTKRPTENKPMIFDELGQVLRTQFGLSAKQSSETLSQYKADYIKDKIALIKTSTSFINGKVKNLTRYLLSALRDDYQSPQTNLTHTANQIAKIDIETQTKFHRFQEAQLLQLFETLPEQKKVALIHQFEKFLVGIYQKLYGRDGLKNVLIQEQLCIFLKKNHPELREQLSTYEEWLAVS